MSTDSGNKPASRAAACSAWMALTASPRDTPGAVLNEMVAAGSWPTWFTARGMARSSMRATEDSATGRPMLDVT